MVSYYWRRLCQVLLLGATCCLLGMTCWMKGETVSAQGKIDYAVWERYRAQVQHPTTSIKPVDLERAQENIRRYQWARDYVGQLRSEADRILQRLSPDYLARLIERTTPGCYGPCPACRAKGLPWHPNGQWAWSASDPDRLTCRVCRTVFPNEEFPESIVLQSQWDPEQRFGFVGGEPFNCFGYQARPSLTGIIRANKIDYVTGYLLRTLAIAYALTQDVRYARGARQILLRLAEVVPKYLVRAGCAYGEYADCDPHVAAENILNLPNDELVTPPNKPDRKLYSGYWSASRVGTAGMDGGLATRMARAYDLTCTAQENGKPVYSEAERIRIERDVLLESVYLALCDPSINNKSVANRAGAAMVGLCVGHPDLVRFGLEGFQKTVDGWFLPDGGTSESAAYALMTMSGIRNFPLMLRDYSDPPGYTGPDGRRIEHFDACRDTRYGDCWQGLIWTLQGDLRHPPTADSYRTTAIGASFAELIALAYPTPEHLALLKELSGDKAPAAPGEAIFYRVPGIEQKPTPPLALPDVVFPFLSQGHLRTGPQGRDSLALLNASHWGVHHHLDSLDLYYWKDGHELLSDLGYLWDHPDKYQTTRTFAHNLVLLDGRDQVRQGRGGSFHLFGLTPHVKVMEASSRAYAEASVYRRTVLQVEHEEAGSYLVDIFRVQGGTHRQYVFHGPNNDFTVHGIDLQATQEAPKLLDGLPVENLRTGSGDHPWQITWLLEGGYTFTAFSVGGENETVLLGQGWGQRDHRNTDRGAKLPYILRATEGPGLDQFVTIFCANPADRPLVKEVRRLPLTQEAPADAMLLAIETTRGTDLVLSMLTPTLLQVSTPFGRLTCDGCAAVVRQAGSRQQAMALFGGTRLSLGRTVLSCPHAAYVGKVLEVGRAEGDSWFVLEGDLPEEKAAGQTLFVRDGDTWRAYPIRDVRRAEGRVRIYTKVAHAGFEARQGEEWKYVPVRFQ